jgi:formate/nitrite transporter
MQSLILDPGLASEVILKSGIKKSHLPVTKMLVLSFLAGTYLAVGGQSMFAVLTGVDRNQGPVKFLGGAAFSVGLMLIVLAGAELFTGNCLILMAVLAKRIFWHEMLFDWGVVYAGNFIGSITFAGMIYGTGLLGWNNGAGDDTSALTATGKTACAIAITKAKLESSQIFLRGIGANYLVCLAIILAAAAKSPAGKFLGILFPIQMFITIGFEHSVANMYIFSLATMMNCDVYHGDYWRNLILCTLGNIVGACLLALSYWFVNIYGGKHEVETVPYDPASPHIFHTSKDVNSPTTLPPPVEKKDNSPV